MTNTTNIAHWAYYNLLQKSWDTLSIMHLSFASLAPRYLGTSRDHGHTHSLQADKSLANIHRITRNAGHLWHHVTNKVPAPIPLKKSLTHTMFELLKIPGPNDHHQDKAATPYMFPAGRDVSMHKSPPLSGWVPHYCPGTWGPGIQMVGALSLYSRKLCVWKNMHGSTHMFRVYSLPTLLHHPFFWTHVSFICSTQ